MGLSRLRVRRAVLTKRKKKNKSAECSLYGRENN